MYDKIHFPEAFSNSGYARCGSDVHLKGGKARGIINEPACLTAYPDRLVCHICGNNVQVFCPPNDRVIWLSRFLDASRQKSRQPR